MCTTSGQITLQQPFAAAMAAGVSHFTRRGKATAFAAGGEWVAIHCGSNDEHLKKPAVMAAIRKHWPECPSDEVSTQQWLAASGVTRSHYLC